MLGWYIFGGVAAVVLIALIIFLVLHFIKKKKIEESEREVSKKVDDVTSSLSSLFGGNDNIEEIKKMGSRVTVLIKDIEKVNKEEIQKQFDSVMFMGNKIVFVIGSMSEEFSALLKEKTK